MADLATLINDTIKEIYENNPTEEMRDKLIILSQKIHDLSTILYNDGTGIRACTQINIGDKYIVKISDDEFVVANYYYQQLENIDSLQSYSSMSTLLNTEFISSI